MRKLCDPGEVPVDRVRLLHLARIEKHALRLFELWLGTPDGEHPDPDAWYEEGDALMRYLLAVEEEDAGRDDD